MKPSKRIIELRGGSEGSIEFLESMIKAILDYLDEEYDKQDTCYLCGGSHRLEEHTLYD